MKRKADNWKRNIIIFIDIIIILILIKYVFGGADLYKDEYRIYKCDYKSLSVFQTKITTNIDGEEVTIKGKVTSLLTDPLTMYDSSGNRIAYAGDSYGIISQDDHGIYVDDEFVVNMDGGINVLGNKYHLKNENGEIIATAKFNPINTKGAIEDNDGNIIATYESNFFRKDYTVKICDNNICSDKAMLMIIASYASDVLFDTEK